MDSSIIPIKISFLLLSIYMFFSLSTSDTSQDVQDCTQSLVGLATCLPYVGETAKSPTPDCCNGLKQVLRTNRKCLCVIIKDRNDPNLSLDINVTLALTLPQVCNTPANISECPALLNLPPNSPDAQVFYQINSTSSASSPLAGGPIANVGPGPLGAGGDRSIGQQQSSSYGNGKKWITLCGTMLIWVFSTNMRV